MKYNYVVFVCCLLISSSVFAVPVDWNGQFGIDSTVIKNHRRDSADCTYNDGANGSQCIKPGNDNARFQTYIFRLNPQIIVNDSATIKAELATSSYRGGFLGGNSEWGDPGNSSYYNVYSGDNSLNVNKAYVELYADTALFRLGKYAKHFGMGAVLNSGEQTFDRFFTLFDGFEADFKIGNFKLTPHWAKIYTNTSQPSGKFDVIEKGVIANYENPNTNLQFGIYYATRETESNSDFYASGGPHSVNIVDIYIAKQWETFDLALEIPMLTGEVGSTYNGVSDANFDTNAYLAKLDYKASPSWLFGLDAGLVKGDDGSSDNVEAMYLHPNFQIAKIMYRYNYNAFTDSNKNIFESAIANSTFYKLRMSYITDAWTWNVGFIKAQANEVAQDGSDFFSHEHRRLVASANEDQSNDLGYELDLSFDYVWNPSILVHGFLAYHKVGDYYAFDNDDSTEIDVSDVMSYGFNVGVSF